MNGAMLRYVCSCGVISLVTLFAIHAGAAPTVTLVVPDRTITFVAPASPVLYATATYSASPPPAVVTRVEFYDGDTLLGTVTSPNALNGGYALVWPNPAGGPHLVTVRAFDSAGTTGVSAAQAVYVIAGRAPPAVSLSAPPSGTIVGPEATIGLRADATTTGTIQRVEFMAGTTVVGTAFTAPYVASWVNPSPGEYAVLARAYDETGLVGVSHPAFVQVLPSPRDASVVLTAPASGSTVPAGIPLLMKASAVSPDLPPARVEFYSGTTLLGTVASAPYDYTWPVPQVGTQALSARLYDVRGRSVTSASVPITAVSNTLPTVALTAPVSGARFVSPDPIPLVATASRTGGSIARVEFFDGTKLVGTSSLSPYSVTWTGATVGSHTITARATDNVGATATSAAATISVVTNQPPRAAMSSPATDAVFVAGQTVPFAATASDPDGGVARVEFLDGSTIVGTSTATPYAFPWLPAVGNYTVAARAVDTRNATAMSTAAKIYVVATSAPVSTITAPVANAAFVLGRTVPITGDAILPGKAVSKLDFYADGALIGSVAGTNAGHASRSLNWTGATIGSHVLTVRAIASDTTSVASSPVTISVRELTTELFEPAAGQVFVAPAAIRISAAGGETGGSASRLELLQGSTVLKTFTAPPFVFDWTGIAPGVYTFASRITDAGGLSVTSSPVTVRVLGTPTVDVIAGLDGSTVTSDNALIRGTVQAPLNSAVTVNGRVAVVDPSGRFFVNGLPLVAGANPIAVAVQMPDGSTITRNLAVTSTGTAPFDISLDAREGMAPFSPTLTIANRTGATFAHIDIDTDNDGRVDRVVTAMPDGKAQVGLTYATPGVYSIKVSAYDDRSALLYTGELAVHVYDARSLAVKVSLVYNDMLRQLAAGKIDAAVGALTSTARERWRSALQALAPNLPAAVAGLGRIDQIRIADDFADLTVVRTKADGDYAYHVILIRDDDGMWRIDSM